MRSDILPVLKIGGWAAHIDNGLTWDYEDVGAPIDSHSRLLSIDQLRELPAKLQALKIDR